MLAETASIRVSTVARSPSSASRTAAGIARSAMRRSAMCGDFTSSNIIPRRPSMRSTAGSMTVADQRGNTSGSAAPSASATAVTCAKYAISPAPPTYATVGRRRRSTTGRSSTFAESTRSSRRAASAACASGTRSFTPIVLRKTSERRGTRATCARKPARSMETPRSATASSIIAARFSASTSVGRAAERTAGCHASSTAIPSGSRIARSSCTYAPPTVAS